jgi:hypothetical protein
VEKGEWGDPAINAALVEVCNVGSIAVTGWYLREGVMAQGKIHTPSHKAAEGAL